mgnify:CR=1 FL=1
MSETVFDRRWEKGPKVVAIGGGTGLSTMLRGLKKYTKNLTAVVTVDGVYDEQDASGNDVTVPRFNLLFVDKIE